jgi:hypothetical protein
MVEVSRLDPRNSVNCKHKKHEKNYTKAYHSKFLKISNKVKMEALTEKKFYIMYGATQRKTTADFLLEILHVRRE